MVNRKLETNIPDIYAAGDCVQFSEPPEGRKEIEQVWYTGRMMGELAAKNILGEQVDYSPGPWFNSAKFFDVEYQTYGKVNNELDDNQAQYYWEKEDASKCVKVVFEKSSERFVGINSFGIRLRHECFDRWLRQGKTVDYVMQHFREALFDPEFFKDEVPDIIEKYNKYLKKVIHT
jgi:NADPH-dependent 2,4-dienoyl-CoA reductase/sulfur reductase-like enzyme